MSRRLTPAEKRSARFKEAQSSLTPDQLLEQKAQNEAPASSPLVAATLAELRNAKKWFLEFLKDIHPEINADAEYFAPDAGLPDPTLLREYARYIVRSRVGHISTKLSVHTIQHYMRLLVAVLQRECNHDKFSISTIRAELSEFVRVDLAKQEGLDTARHTKAVAHCDDVTRIVTMLYDANYLTTFPNMRIVLNLNLYILLVIDVCGRGGEIARSYARPEHMCLRWSDISFVLIQRPDDEWHIEAHVKIQWSKGQTTDSSAYRTIPLAGLLPMTMATQDTLRLLLNLALMDGVFANGVKSWKQLYNMRLPPEVAHTGRKIKMSPHMLDVPVLRRMVDRKVTDTPVHTLDMQTEIRRLGRACGFENRLTAYCFRRGVAYILASQASVENRMFLMGHSRPSCYTPYRSPISTIDFPALFRGVEERPVRHLSGISLNRSTTAPQRVSEAGEQAITRDEDVQSASEEIETIRRAILEKHISLAAASRSSDPLLEDYARAAATYRSAIKSATVRILRKEYKEHFEMLDIEPNDASQVIQGTAVEEQNKVGEDQDSLFIPEDEEDAVNQALSLMEQGSPNADDLSVEDDLMDDLFGQDDDFDMDEEPPTTVQALHGHHKQDRSLKTRFLSKRGRSAYNDILVDLEEACKGTEAEMSDCLTRWFSVCHNVDQFPPGEEPLPGAYSCRFCGEDLSKLHKPYAHTHACAKVDAVARAQALLDTVCPLDAPCQFQTIGTKEASGQLVTCDETFDTAAARGNHMRTHVKTMTKKNDDGVKIPTCFFGDCATCPKKGPFSRNGPDFESEDDKLTHVWSHHYITIFKTPVVKHCEYCDVWLIEPYQWIAHAQDHMEDAASIIAELGYSGVHYGRNVIPRICPFCYHDESLPAHERIETYTREGHPKHISKHLPLDGDPVEHCPCYPATCTKPEEMEVDELVKHMKAAHAIDIPSRHAKSSRKALSDITNDKAPRKKKAKVADPDESE